MRARAAVLGGGREGAGTAAVWREGLGRPRGEVVSPLRLTKGQLPDQLDAVPKGLPLPILLSRDEFALLVTAHQAVHGAHQRPQAWADFEQLRSKVERCGEFCLQHTNMRASVVALLRRLLQ